LHRGQERLPVGRAAAKTIVELPANRYPLVVLPSTFSPLPSTLSSVLSPMEELLQQLQALKEAVATGKDSL